MIAIRPPRPRLSIDNGWDRSAGANPDSGPSDVAERVDDPETFDGLAVLEIFGEQDNRPGAQRRFDDWGVPVRRTGHTTSAHPGSNQLRMEGLDLELAKRIDCSTRRIGRQWDGKLSGDRDVELPEYLDAHDEPIAFLLQEASCASLLFGESASNRWTRTFVSTNFGSTLMQFVPGPPGVTSPGVARTGHCQQMLARRVPPSIVSGIHGEKLPNYRIHRCVLLNGSNAGAFEGVVIDHDCQVPLTVSFSTD